MTIKRLWMVTTAIALVMGTCSYVNRSITYAHREAFIQRQKRAFKEAGITFSASDRSASHVVAIDMSRSTVGLGWLRDQLSLWEYSMIDTIVLPLQHNQEEAIRLATDYRHIAFRRNDGSRVVDSGVGRD